jgi:arylsulfatase
VRLVAVGRTLALLLASASLSACGREIRESGHPACRAIERAEDAGGWNVVLVVAGGLRRDRVGAYGGPARTPAFDAFAARELLFERARSQAPWSKPSVATLFTSLHPSQHGVASHPFPQQSFAHQTFSAPVGRADVLAPELATLAELLRGAGWRTAAFVANPWLDRRFGFDQGFEHYDDSAARWGQPGGEIARAALRWLARLGPDERFFLYVHTVDSQRPYGLLDWNEVLARADELAADPRPLPPGARAVFQSLRFAQHYARPGALRPSLALLEMAYDSGVESFDAALGELLDGLRASPAWERSAVLVTSDHGEPLFEHGHANRGAGLFESELAIPLAARLPGTSARAGRIDCAVGLVDVMPTLCAVLGVACPEPVFGRSFVAVAGAPAEDGERFGVAEGAIGHPRNRALIGRRYKLVHEPDGAQRPRATDMPWELYDLVADPGETHDLLGDDFIPSRIEHLHRRMADELERAVPGYAPPAAAEAPAAGGKEADS